MERITTTKETLPQTIAAHPKGPAWVIGWALVALFRCQTGDEQAANETNKRNGMGFTKADSRRGCITAKYFLKHKTLRDEEVKYWNHPRLYKYAKQLQAIKESRQATTSTIH